MVLKQSVSEDNFADFVIFSKALGSKTLHHLCKHAKKINTPCNNFMKQYLPIHHENEKQFITMTPSEHDKM